MQIRRTVITVCLFLSAWVVGPRLGAHEGIGHNAGTYEITPAAKPPSHLPRLRLTIRDAASGGPTAARFSLTVDGEPYIPAALDEHGMRFISIHERREQRCPFMYVRGTGTTEIGLPPNASRGTVSVVKGFEYLPVTVPFNVDGPVTSVEVPLHRWTDLAADGWQAAEEHLHFDRTDPKHDSDWLTMLAAEDLTHAIFMVVKGPGVWAEQFAYGKAGEGTDGRRLIRPGEEYRDSSQGHINLLGISEVIQPISTGGIGFPGPRFNYPPLRDVLLRGRELGGIGGPAHGGGSLSSSTAVLDTVLGAVDFIEIANSRTYRVETWYRLMNGGYLLPPVAGTDLPNHAFRDWWQPLLGEVRTYVKVGDRLDFDSWAQSVKKGHVFVTSGPLIHFTVNGAGPGEVVSLPAGGGEIEIDARLESPRPLESLEIVHMGEPLKVAAQISQVDGIHRREIRHRLHISQSGWVAARGTGGRKTALERDEGIPRHEVAHTAAVQVLVGDQPIQSQPDLQVLLEQLTLQKEYYRNEAVYERPEDRHRFVGLFEEAIDRLRQRIKD